MKKLNWDLLPSDKKKVLRKYKKTMILGSIDMSQDRLLEILKDNDSQMVLWCSYKEAGISGLKGSQFRTLSIDKLSETLEDSSNAVIIKHFQKDLSYMIKELRPNKIVFINGSWNKTIHQRKEFWEANKYNIPIEFVSPFSNEKEALKFTNIDIKEDIEKDFMKIAENEASRSFCWTFQNGAVIVKNGNVLVKSHNEVNPYKSYCMHNGCIREELKLAPGEELEKCMATHAEQNAISQAAKLGVSIDGAVLYTTTFPCGLCAKAIASSGIKEVFYKNPYSYKIGEEIMKNLKLTNIK